MDLYMHMRSLSLTVLLWYSQHSYHMDLKHMDLVLNDAQLISSVF